MIFKDLAPITEERDARKYRRDVLLREAAQPLGIHDAAQTIWVRKRFTVSRASEGK